MSINRFSNNFIKFMLSGPTMNSLLFIFDFVGKTIIQLGFFASKLSLNLK